MRVLYDHQTFSIQNYGGISKYYCELITNLRSIDSKDHFELGLFFSNNDHLNEYEINNFKNFFKSYNIRGKGILNWLMYNYNSKISQNQIQNCDILHATYYDSYFKSELKKRKCPLVATIHDMTNEKLKYLYPELDHFKTIENKRRIYNLADAVIAISENTKNDIKEVYGVSGNKISVINHGFSKLQTFTTQDNNFPALPVNYILYVGQRIIYKNFKLFLEGLVPVLQKYDDLMLVCAGGGQFTNDERNLFKRYGLSNVIKYYDITSNSILDYYYQNALLFVFPSTYEGFGLPILEAFANGCPVAISNTSCFPEIAAQSAAYFNPYSVDSIAEVIEDLVKNENKRAMYRKKGTERLEIYSWEKTAQETLALYKSLIA